MTYIDNLIKKHCPNGVEWKTTEEIFNIKNGYTPSKKNKEYWENGTIPWFRMEDIRINGRILSDSIQHVSESAVKGQLVSKNSLFMSTTATLGEHALVTVPFITNQQITSFSLNNEWSNKADIKFFFYCFFDFGKWIVKNANKNGGLSIINIKKLKQFQLPVPPLKIQQEIVKILDKFTDYVTELTTELTDRKKQYAYYRDKLLSFEDEVYKVEWKTLGEVGELIRGNGLQKKDFTETGVPAIHYGQIYTYYGTFADKTKSFVSQELAKKLKKAQYGDVLIAGTSENVDDVMKPLGWFGGEIVFSGDMYSFRPRGNVLTKYLTYILQTEMFHKYKTRYAQGTKVIRVKADNFLKFKIPIPPLEEQERIVAILDKFDRLMHSITEGLPKEIELRQKQYAYFRDKLLTFEQKG